MLRAFDNKAKDIADTASSRDTLISLESSSSNGNMNGNVSGAAQSHLTVKPSVKLLWVSLNEYSPSVQFFVLSFGVFFFYVLYGYFQELIFRLEGMKPFGWYLTLVQFFLYAIFGLAETKIKGDLIERRIPMRFYLLLAFLTVATMGLSNTSVAYLNYPTQVMFKCCKLIPVLIGSILIQGKPTNIFDFLGAISMSLGLVFFTLADALISPKYDTTGVVMISLALCADAAIGNVQEKNMKHYKASNTEVVLYSYGVGFFYIFFYLFVSGQLGDAFQFCAEYPIETYGYFTIFSITGYFGVQIVLELIKSSGVFIAVTVTTCRKAVTIILSFLFFSKPFTAQYLWSGLLVLFGIYLNVYGKDKTRTWTLQTAIQKIRQFVHIRVAKRSSIPETLQV